MVTRKKKTAKAVTEENALQGSGALRRGLGALKQTIEDLSLSLREIQGPLADTRESLPKATTHLDRITTQTEQATHRVLDVVENISTQQIEIINCLNQALNALSDSGEDSAAISAWLEKAEEVANRSQNDAFTIMDALQFQDITAQQINHAASLLEEVDEKIGEILGDIDENSVSPGVDSSVKRRKGRQNRSFDPHADMEVKHTDQTAIDDLVRLNHESKSS